MGLYQRFRRTKEQPFSIVDREVSLGLYKRKTRIPGVDFTKLKLSSILTSFYWPGNTFGQMSSRKRGDAWVRLRKVSILSVHERSLVVRRPAPAPAKWCPGCQAPAVMMKPELAAAVSLQTTRTIYRGVESGQVHYVEGLEGLVVCPDVSH